MNFTKNIVLFLLFTLFQNGYSQVTKTIQKVKKKDTVMPKPHLVEVEERSSKKKRTEKPKYYNYFYEFINTNSVGVQYKNTKINQNNKEIEFESIDSILWNVKSKSIHIIDFKDDYIYYKYNKSNIVDTYRIKNYVVYKKKKNYGVILKKFIIPAQYDSIGKPILVKGKDPMILVANKKKGKLIWGIIDSDGNTVIPIEFDAINVPVPTDLHLPENTGGLWGTNSDIGGMMIGRYDGLYQNQKIIVKKQNKYGLYNAIGKQILKVEYDDINKNKSLDYYSLKKDNKYGFLMLKRNNVSTWGKVYVPTQSLKDLILIPKLDFPILKDKRYYIQNSDGIKIYIDKSEVLNLLNK